MKKWNRLTLFSLEDPRLRTDTKCWAEERTLFIVSTKMRRYQLREIGNSKKTDPHFSQCTVKLHWAGTSSCRSQQMPEALDLKKKWLGKSVEQKTDWELLKIRHRFWFRKCSSHRLLHSGYQGINLMIFKVFFYPILYDVLSLHSSLDTSVSTATDMCTQMGCFNEDYTT